MTLAINPGERQVASPIWDFTTSFESIDTVVNSTGHTSFTDKDATFTTSGNEVVEHEAVLEILGSSLPQPTKVRNLTPKISAFNLNTGHITRISNGRARFQVSAPGVERFVSYPVSREGDATFSGFVEDSLATACMNNVDSLISGLTPGTATQNIFSSANYSGLAFTRNRNLFAGGLDITCIPAAAFSGSPSPLYVGCLVTPDIVVCANHVSGLSEFYFITGNNSLVTREVTGGQRIGETDIHLLKLASNVPDPVTPAKVLPADYGIYLPGLQYGVPVVARVQSNQLFLVETTGNPGNAKQPTGAYANWYPTGYASGEDVVIVGDSGSPAFFVIDNQMVLAWIWGGTADGSFVADYIDDINEAIASLGSNSSLDIINLDYPTY